VASLQEGLKLKTRLCEDEEGQDTGERRRRSLSSSNLLLKTGGEFGCGGRDEENVNKASKQFYFADVKRYGRSYLGDDSLKGRSICRYQEKLRAQERLGIFDDPQRQRPMSADVSALSENNGPAFSTPLRASFRRRPTTMIEDAR